MNKTLHRFLPIAYNGIRSILSPLISILFSFIVISYFSKELWGNFVEYLLLFFIASNICNWGSITYLMRAFSEKPKNMIQEWQQLFLARLPICFAFIVLIFFMYDIQNTLYLSIWLIGAFIYNSFNAVIFYNRDFLKNIGIEIVSFLVLIYLIYFHKDQMSISVLIQIYAISLALKAVITVLLYFQFLYFKKLHFSLSILKISFPFFLLGISGFLYSRADLYVYSFFYSGTLLGEYQVISGLLIFSQSVVTILLFPYIKNIYRLPNESILRIKKLIATYGFLLNLIIIGCIYAVLRFFFDITLTPLQFCIAIFIGFPPYLYSIHIFYLFKEKKEKVVLKINVLCLLLNLIVSVILLSLNFGVTGVLIGNMVIQLFCIYYYLRFKITT